MIYVPELDSYSCYYVRDSNTIRAYKQNPAVNREIEYRDYYVNSHYIYADGVQNFSQYSTLPICLDNSVLTSQYSYRNDFADICIIAFILIGVTWFIISSLLKTLFKGRKLY